MSEIDELLAECLEVDTKLIEAPPGIASHEDILDIAAKQNLHLKLILGVQKGMIQEIREMIDENHSKDR